METVKPEKIEDLEERIKILSNEISDKKIEIEELKGNLGTTSVSNLLPRHHQTLRMVSALEKLLDNLDHICAEKLGELKIITNIK